MEITNLADETLIDLLHVCETFCKERNSSIHTFNKTVAFNLLNTYVNDRNSAVFLEYIGNEVAGGAIIHRIQNYCTQWIGIVSNLYVMPDCRGTGVSRKLMQSTIDWFDSNECVFNKMNGGGWSENDKTLGNLVKKFGYQDDTPSWIRKGKICQ